MGPSTAKMQDQRDVASPSIASNVDSRGYTTGSDLVENANQKEIMAKIKRLEFSREAEIFKALGHPIRLKIVYGLMKLGGCNVKNMQECLGLHQATVSQHLIHLKNRGIITSSRQGLEMVYRMADTRTTSIVKKIVNGIEKET